MSIILYTMLLTYIIYKCMWVYIQLLRNKSVSFYIDNFNNLEISLIYNKIKLKIINVIMIKNY